MMDAEKAIGFSPVETHFIRFSVLCHFLVMSLDKRDWATTDGDQRKTVLYLPSVAKSLKESIWS